MATAPYIVPFSPSKRFLASMVLALSNFMVVLDMTIANVSVPHIAGDMGISASQGTWVITSYAVAEAICVPLTGWLAQRFGAVRIFLTGMIGFGLWMLFGGHGGSKAGFDNLWRHGGFLATGWHGLVMSLAVNSGCPTAQ